MKVGINNDGATYVEGYVSKIRKGGSAAQSANIHCSTRTKEIP